MIYFDNAATSYPKPVNVRQGIEKYFTTCGANPGRAGHQMAMQTAKEVYNTREAVCKLFHFPDTENVIFTLNCTHALNIAIKGTVKQGGHVIISDMEHNSVIRTVYALQKEGKITYDVAKTFPNDTAATLASFEKLIKPNTQLICCIQGSNAFGVRLPVEEICKLAHNRGILMLVDAAQTAGVLDINLASSKIDFLCTAGHKSLFGPTGTGLLITADGEQIQPFIHGGTGSKSVDPEQPDFMPDHLESGTLNTLGIIGLQEGINFVLKRTTQRIYEHEISICACIYRELKTYNNVSLYTSEPEYGKSLPVLSFNCSDYSGEETSSKLSEKGFALRGGLHCAPLAHDRFGTLERGTARISPGCFTTYEQAEKLCSAIKNL